MNETCIQIDDLARVVALPEGDPGRHHLDNCPRCQSLADMLRELAVSSEEPPPEAALEPTDERLVTMIVNGPPVPVPVPVADAAAAPSAGTPPATAAAGRPRAPSSPPRKRLWFEFTGAQLVGAAVALLVVNTLAMVLWRAQSPPTPAVSFPSTGAPGFFTESVQEMPGVVVLKWSAIPRATAYRVIFRDAAMRLIGGLAPTGTAYFRMDSSALPAGLKRGSTIGWEVEALAGDELLAVSSTRALRVP